MTAPAASSKKLGGKARGRDIYVLSPEGDHICTFALPFPTHLIHIDREGFLYSWANEGITLKKYRLHYLK